MFVQITDWRGEQVSIDPLRVIKIRPAGHADEPKKMVFIDYVSGGTFADGKLDKIVKLFGTYMNPRQTCRAHAASASPGLLAAAVYVASVCGETRSMQGFAGPRISNA
jgi:hypothetical protein